MSNEVANASAKGLTFQVPAHILARIKAAGLKNIADKSTVNQITFGDHAWVMHINGEKKLVQKSNEDGELENVQILRVIVLGATQNRGRSYYEGNYDRNNPRGPDCWSSDGKRPDLGVPEPRGKTCEAHNCPMAVKGSRVIDGKELVACAQHKFLAVIPSQNLTFPAMRIKLPVTSLWDKQDEESMAQGWYAWDNYCDLLRANGVDFTGALVTKMRLATVNYQKIQFSRGDWLDEDQLAKVMARLEGDGGEEVKKLLAGFTVREAPAQPAGKPLPKDETPVDLDSTGGGVDFAKLAAEKQAKAQAEARANEKAKAEAEADRIAQEQRLKAHIAMEAEAEKARKLAELKAQLAALQGGQGAPEVPQQPMTAVEAEKVTTRKRATRAEMEARRAAEAAAKGPIPAAATIPQAEDAGAFDDVPAPAGAPLSGEVLPPQTAMPDRSTKPKEIPNVAPVEVPQALARVLGNWA